MSFINTYYLMIPSLVHDTAIVFLRKNNMLLIYINSIFNSIFEILNIKSPKNSHFLQ